MGSYKINFKQLVQEAKLSDMLSALERGLEKFGIDYYLVGAVARDLWMTAIHDIPPSRITGDIDFAVLIKDADTYTDLKEYLIDKEGFSPYKGNAFVLGWKGWAWVDLLPFGEIEDKNAQVRLDGSGLTNISVPGFREVYESGLPHAELEGKHNFKFCSLPGLILLKLIAYLERPEARRDDIVDISHILLHFFEMHSNHIYENHNDLFGDRELLEIGAHVVGREMASILRKNPELYDQIRNLLKLNSGKPDESDIGRIMAEHFRNTVVENVLVIRDMLAGLTESVH